MPEEIADSGTNEGAVDAGQVEEGAPAEGAGEPAAPSLPPEMIERARGYGLDSDQVLNFDAATLDRMFANIDKKIINQPDPAMQAQHQQQQAAEQASQVPQYEPFAMQFDEDVAEGLINPIQGMNDHFNNQMKAMHETNLKLIEHINALQTSAEVMQFDRFIESLGGDWEDVYGAGPTQELDEDSDSFKNRLEVFSGAKALQKHSPGTVKPTAAWKRSHGSFNLDRVREVEKKKLEKQAEESRRKFGERPTGSGGAKEEKSPRDEALAALRG
jgi:hypothetical protein